jgi:hypothetical protein
MKREKIKSYQMPALSYEATKCRKKYAYLIMPEKIKNYQVPALSFVYT